ncbi:MAG: OmpA family protein, partial [Gammaproteobacteria bacterium]|nr:OmpA family protein [Gammaproteobacteria bacterium]
QLAAELGRVLSIQVRGHSDQVGGEKMNVLLSQERADEVLNAIEQQSSLLKRTGILESSGFSYRYQEVVESRALVSNRRVDFYVIDRSLNFQE